MNTKQKSLIPCRNLIALLAALALVAAPAAHAQLTAGNVRAAQRAGTKLVDIDYDVTGIATPVTVILEISSDGGTTWAVPATTLTGAVGTNVTPGPDLRITWNAGADWNNQTSAQTKFRLKVGDLLPDLADFAVVPAGEFTMGDTLDGESDAPPHTVYVSAFYMQKKGVTKTDWDAVRAWGLAHGYTDLAVGAGKAGDHPVQWVTWYDVVKWCNARSEKEGLTPCYYTDAGQSVIYKTGNTNITNTMVKWSANGYRLPTEAEREKASRGGVAGLRFPWGNTISHANANFCNNGGESYATGAGGYDPVWGTGAPPYTSPGGSFPANGYGIFDMAGNMSEWCWDWYGSGYYGVSPATDPDGPSGSDRVLRGGGSDNRAIYCRAANRLPTTPGWTSNGIGFRPVRKTPDLADFAVVPAGEFTMGDTLDGESDAPPHTVYVSAFYMQKKGVTKADWDAVRAWGVLHGYTDLAVGAGKAADHPVQWVTWYEVVKWCNARSENEGLTPCYYTDAGQSVIYKTGNTNITNTMVKWSANGYRLPTEAEREKASRGGVAGLRFPWGNTISHANANFCNNGGESYATGAGGYDPVWGTGAPPYTSPGGSFPANGYGIFDMAGNMSEWCWDWYGSGYYGVSPATDPDGPSGSDRVLRGGGSDNRAIYCRAANRLPTTPGWTSNGIGFRPVRKTPWVQAESPSISVDTHDYASLTINSLHGTVPGAGWYVVNTTCQITATPDPGYLFSEWTGDAGGNANPLSVVMDANKSIGATFVQDTRDPDGDGLTNYQEIVVYHTNPNVGDTDGDGFDDGVEVGLGFDPASATSTPETEMVIYTAVEVRFGAARGQSYRIESSTDLQTWTPVESGIAGTGGMVARLYSIREIPKRYFRAVRE